MVSTTYGDPQYYTHRPGSSPRIRHGVVAFKKSHQKISRKTTERLSICFCRRRQQDDVVKKLSFFFCRDDRGGGGERERRCERPGEWGAQASPVNTSFERRDGRWKRGEVRGIVLLCGGFAHRPPRRRAACCGGRAHARVYWRLRLRGRRYRAKLCEKTAGGQPQWRVRPRHPG